MPEQNRMKPRVSGPTFFASCLLVPAFLYGLWLLDPRVDALDRRARQLAGWSAVDCGCSATTDHIDQAVAQKQAAVRACASQAHKQHAPFRARFNNYTRTGLYSQVIVGTAEGRLFSLSMSPEQPLKQEACSSLPCR